MGLGFLFLPRFSLNLLLLVGCACVVVIRPGNLLSVCFRTIVNLSPQYLFVWRLDNCVWCELVSSRLEWSRDVKRFSPTPRDVVILSASGIAAMTCEYFQTCWRTRIFFVTHGKRDFLRDEALLANIRVRLSVKKKSDVKR